jgi:hypothetical protein
MHLYPRVVFISLVFLLTFSACSPFSQKPETTQTVAFIYTEVALTYSAQRTQNYILTPSPTITSTQTETPLPPTETPTLIPSTPTKSPTITIQPVNDKCEYVSQSIPDYTTYKPGDPFTITWTIKNVGDFTWTTGYKIRFYAGDRLEAPPEVALSREVKPNTTYDITMNMIAPANPNTYNTIWVVTSTTENGGKNICSFYLYIKVQN